MLKAIVKFSILKIEILLLFVLYDANIIHVLAVAHKI